MGTSKKHGNYTTVARGMLFLLPSAHIAFPSAIIPSLNTFCKLILSPHSRFEKVELLYTFSISRVTISSFWGMLLLYPRKATTDKMKGSSHKFPFPPTSMVKTQDQRISPMLPVKTFLQCLKTGPSDPGLLSGLERLSEGRSSSVHSVDLI